MANDFFSIHELESTRFNVMEFTGKWRESFGNPEMQGVWIVYGESFNGKSTFTLQLARYLTNFVKHKVLINSFEEGKTESFKLAVRRANLSTVGEKILLGNRVAIKDLKKKLTKQRSPEVIIIDSLQYSGLDKPSFQKLVDEFRNKLWIFISHADGKIPRGALARHVLNDASVKIRVQGFKAFPQSRYGGGHDYIINAERAAAYHAEID